MIKAVIFDLDGVIVSTDDLHFHAWKKIADQEGIPFDQHMNHQLRGVSRMESLDIILNQASKPYTEQEKRALAEKKNADYVQMLNQLGPKDILPQVMDLIRFLKEKHVMIAIGSSSKNTAKILKQIGLDQTFDQVADGNDITQSKPAPDVFLVAAEKLKVEPKYCLVVEDAIAGVEAAKAAGMKCVAVSDAIKSPLADYRFHHLLEIKNLI